TGPGLKERMDSLRVEIDESAECINGYIRELQQIGCMFKGFEEGLVDFHSTYRGRTILLCWKLGEERIGYCHEMDAGYAGRQPITAEMAEELEGTRTAGGGSADRAAHAASVSRASIPAARISFARI